MEPMARYTHILRYVASMPFLDRLELAAVMRIADRTTHEAVADLCEDGFFSSIRHATQHTASTRRLCITSRGLRYLAREDGFDAYEMLGRYPVSEHWKRILLQRLDAVAVIYRVASSLAFAGGPIRFRWYRRSPLDAAVVLEDERTIGIVRQGLTSDRTGFSKRVWRLLDGARPNCLLVITPDEMRLRNARHLLRRSREPVFLTTERNAARVTSKLGVWHRVSSDAWYDLSSALSDVFRDGLVPREQPLSRMVVLNDLATPDRKQDVADHLLPAVLKPAEKRALDVIYDWPWITASELAALMGVSAQRISQVAVPLINVGLICRTRMEGQDRLGLTDKGLAVLAKRDRTSVGRLRKQWSSESTGDSEPTTWREILGRRSRLLARNMEHTEAVHDFLASLSRQAKDKGYEVVQIDPPHRASRYFWYNYKLYSIHPDAFGMLRRGEELMPFFLEWERRAVRPGTMSARLAPYLRYYSSHAPLDDHGVLPLVLMVFDEHMVESRFLRVAKEGTERMGIDVPLWVSHKEVLLKLGPLGESWRSPQSLERGAFPGKSRHRGTTLTSHLRDA